VHVGHKNYSQQAEQRLGPISHGVGALGLVGWVLGCAVACALIDPLATLRILWNFSHEVVALLAFIVVRGIVILSQGRNSG
jgi:hypothetical protein